MKKINGLTLEEAKTLAFKAGFEGEKYRMDCAQETWHGVSTALGIKNPMIFKVLSAFEGGGGISSEGSCGAISGGLAAFSYYFGRTYEQWEKKEMVFKSADLGMELINRFKEKYGGIRCKDVHLEKFGRTFNLRDRKVDFQIFEEMGGHEFQCPSVVGWTAAQIIDILWEELPGDVNLSDIGELKDFS